MQSSTVTRATSELQTHQFRERAAASTMARESQFPGGSSAGPLAPLRSNAYSREMTSGTPAAAIAPIDMTIDELRGALARVLPFHAAFDGWTDAALAASAGELNVPVERARLAFAGGAADMIQAWIAEIGRAHACTPVTHAHLV